MPSDYTNPTEAVSQFSSGLQASVAPGASERDTTAQIISPTQSADPIRPVEARQQAAMNIVKDMQTPVDVTRSANRMATYNKIIQDTNSRRNAAISSGQVYGDVSTAGQAYTPDGNLSSSRNQVMSEASSYLGNRYVFAGNTHAGIDCSGLVQQVYAKAGIQLPRLAAQQRDAMPGVRTSNIASLRPGDLVAWNDGSHVAIYAGNGYIIQAANPQQGVIKSLLTQQVGYRPGSVIGIAIRLPGE